MIYPMISQVTALARQELYKPMLKATFLSMIYKSHVIDLCVTKLLGGIHLVLQY